MEIMGILLLYEPINGLVAGTVVQWTAKSVSRAGKWQAT